ncbi:TetR/AcrR family transcriptional regulator [Pseudoduganella sp. UC29_106]|uniref:TetR/AcrR family transcriptional regulator n=1 Tax=Pseudoduganella sp. UC29_106 TaxID=3374553 RepID=UPI003756D6CF
MLRGSLYNAYGDKEKIFVLAFKRYHRQILATCRDALAHPDLRIALETYFEKLIALMTSIGEGAHTRGCLTTKTAADETAKGEMILGALRGLLDGMEVLLTERLQKAGKLPLAPQEGARLIVTLTRGLVIMERVYSEPARLRASAAALIDLLLKK